MTDLDRDQASACWVAAWRRACLLVDDKAGHGWFDIDMNEERQLLALLLYVRAQRAGIHPDQVDLAEVAARVGQAAQHVDYPVRYLPGEEKLTADQRRAARKNRLIELALELFDGVTTVGHSLVDVGVERDPVVAALLALDTAPAPQLKEGLSGFMSTLDQIRAPGSSVLSRACAALEVRLAR